MTHVLGIDPGFASIGLAVVKVTAGNLAPVRLDVLTTKKSTSKKNILASDDNMRRVRDISLGICLLLEEFSVQAICMESLSFPRNASSAAKVAMSVGAIGAISASLNIPVLQASPAEIKKAVGAEKMVSGKSPKERAQARLSSKVKVQESILKMFPEASLSGIPRSLHEHAVDALASVVACSTSELFGLMRRLSTL
jgi:Holliday junction resolvasome RuvABC endonuclease subunit